MVCYFVNSMKTTAVRVFLFLLMICGVAFSAQAGTEESIEGSIRMRDGQFYLDIGKGLGMFDEFEAVGQKDLLEEAEKTTDELFSRDAETGLVGRLDALSLKIKRLEDGRVEILSYSPLDWR